MIPAETFERDEETEGEGELTTQGEKQRDPSGGAPTTQNDVRRNFDDDVTEEKDRQSP